MQTITLNIGLNNNPLTIAEIKKYVSGTLNMAIIHNRTELGIYGDVKEPTLLILAKVSTKPNVEVLIRKIKKLCIATTQECIPFKTLEDADLIYNPNFTGERYEFNEQYFINF